MIDSKINSFLDKLVKAYPYLGQEQDALSNIWIPALRTANYESAVKALNAYTKNNAFAPNTDDIIKRTLPTVSQYDKYADDHALRKLAKVYAEIMHLECPEFDTEQEADDWFKQYEG